MKLALFSSGGHAQIYLFRNKKIPVVALGLIKMILAVTATIIVVAFYYLLANNTTMQILSKTRLMTQ
jgi:hypothetical protein